MDETEVQGVVLALLSLQTALLGRLVDRGLLRREDVAEIIGMSQRSIEAGDIDDVAEAALRTLEEVSGGLLRG